jgi:hypothetical protein
MPPMLAVNKVRYGPPAPSRPGGAPESITTANLAMQDRAELGQAIAAHPDDVEAALGTYEQAMFPRAAEAAEAEDIFDLMLGEDAPHSWIAMMNGGEQAS